MPEPGPRSRAPRRRRARRRPAGALRTAAADAALVAHAPSSTRSTSRSFADGNGDGTGDLAGVRVPPAIPPRPRRRRHLVHPVVRLSARRRRLRRRRLPGDRSARSARSPRRRRSSPRRARSASGRSSTSSRTTSPTSTPGSRRRWRRGPARASASASGSDPGAAPTATTTPTGWRSELPGPAWTRTTNADGTPGEWYLHLFTPEQPDLNWDHPDVRRSTRRSCGSGSTAASPASGSTRRPCWSRTRRCPRCPVDPAPGHHPNTTATSSTTSTAAGARSPTAIRATACSSASLAAGRRSGSRSYLRPDELHTAFNFDFLARPWDAASLRGLDRRDARGPRARRRAAPTWVLSNHDVTRPVTRYGREDSLVRVRGASGTGPRPTSPSAGAGPGPPPSSPRPCPARSTSTRATSSASTRSRTCPATEIQDPMHVRSGGVDPGRDGCRVPLPWSGDAAAVRLQPRRRRRRAVAAASRRDWADLTVEAELADPGLDAPPLPRGAADPARRAGPRRRAVRPGSRPQTASSRSPAASGSSRHEPVGRPGRAARGTTQSCSPATTSRTAACRRMPRPGCAPDPPRSPVPGATRTARRESGWSDDARTGRPTMPDVTPSDSDGRGGEHG